ncbi:MAG: response regulator transcription factor [Desulfamplus sp.]|nr:response regulator transcription factor [Desulfamplus sp.]MBF0242110.1 response regulator transcription factor [Desulfamplus sp.]
MSTFEKKSTLQLSENRRILVVEDESHIAEGIKLNLNIKGYDVKIAPDGATGIELWRSWGPDLIVLDVMLPVIDGFSVLKMIRKEDEKLPVLILSAKSSVADKIHGLRCGVDDYIAKPFDLDEFLLRVQRLITHKDWYVKEISQTDGHDLNFDISVSSPFSDQFTFGTNHIDFITGKASCQSGNIILTEQEIKLLKILIENRGKPVSRQDILEAGWGYSSDMTTRTLDNFMVRLRKYFEKDPRKPIYFKSRRSVGYLFDF